MKKKFSVRKRKVIFSKGPVHLVDCDVLMPGGRKLSRQILEHPGSVVIIPRIRKDRYVLIRQFRFAARGWIWEFPAGGVEAGENFRHAGKRELIEEIGYRPGRLKRLISFYPTPGVSGEKMHLFLATDLVPATAEKDEDEELEVHEFSLAQIGKMIQTGRIVDGKTVLGYLWLKNRLSST